MLHIEMISFHMYLTASLELSVGSDLLIVRLGLAHIIGAVQKDFLRFENRCMSVLVCLCCSVSLCIFLSRELS